MAESLAVSHLLGGHLRQQSITSLPRGFRYESKIFVTRNGSDIEPSIGPHEVLRHTSTVFVHPR